MWLVLDRQTYVWLSVMRMGAGRTSGFPNNESFFFATGLRLTLLKHPKQRRSSLKLSVARALYFSIINSFDVVQLDKLARKKMAKQTTCLAVFIILFWCKGFVFAQNVTYQDRVLDTEDSILVIIQQFLLLT